MKDTLVIAHRGFSGLYPENTMLAFKKAKEAGAHGIELDIHLTKDGEIIICHDEDIKRTSNGEGLIKDMTIKEIQEYEFLNSMDFASYPKEDITAPSLNDFLAWLKDTELFVNIEIKNNIFRYQGIVKKTLDLVEKYNLKDRVIISSFNHHTIREVKDLDGEIECGFLNSSSLLNPGKYCKDHRAEYYHPLFISLDEEDLKDLKENNILINTWTVNEKDHMEKVLKMGVNSIITNFPDLLLKLISEK